MGGLNNANFWDLFLPRVQTTPSPSYSGGERHVFDSIHEQKLAARILLQ